MKKLLTLLIFLICAASIADEIDRGQIRRISPIGSVVRSSIVPGWGQLHARNYLQAGFSFTSVSGLIVGGLITHQKFRDIYDNEYLLIAQIDRESPSAIAAYDRANQEYKLRQFFLMTAAGIWAYSIIDSYVGANLYNATNRSKRLIEDVKKIESLGLRLKTDKDVTVYITKKF